MTISEESNLMKKYEKLLDNLIKLHLTNIAETLKKKVLVKHY